MIDQHALTGESTPAEKGVGDRVFASTVMVAGKVYVSVEKSGNETASAKISQILNDTAGYKLTLAAQGRTAGRQGGDPDPGVGAIGLATMGPAGAVAVLNSDFGTGIRMAAPLAMLSSLALCANKGILVKDGRALELMNEVDTVLFDKTGTLTRERPEVGRIIACDGFDAGADPPVRGGRRTEVPPPDRPGDPPQGPGARASSCRRPTTRSTRSATASPSRSRATPSASAAGGSWRWRGSRCRPRSAEALDEAHREGYTMVMVGVDDRLGGAIELQASVRPEVREIVAGLREARDQAHRDHLGRPRGPDPEAGRIAGDGPLLRPGPARRQGRLRRASSRRKGARSASSATGSTTRSP